MNGMHDLLQAKQTLSARLLRAGLRGGVVGMATALRVSEAVARAGQTVHAVGVGRKEVEGTATPQPCVRVYVVQKLAESLLPPKDRIPAVLDGVPTDVIESPPAFIQAKKKTAKKTKAAASTPACSTRRRERQRPIVAGISTGHFQITAGTIGYFCRSRRHGDDPNHVFLLSNNHVYANVNQAQAGDDLYQPGPADGGTAADAAADLTRWVRISLDGTTPNKVDAAIGRLRGDAHRLEICSIGRVSGFSRGTEGMNVRKHGRTTGYTEGRITDESYDALVGMDHNNPDIVALFQDQMRIERIPPYTAIGLGGDSGSLVVQKANLSAVGLYFAGPESGAYGIASQIEDVLNELEIELL
jgi:hypothetical protein